MSNFTDAPWNKPVEEEGTELSEDEIPARRRKPGEEAPDPLTQLIFGSDFSKNELEDTPKAEQQQNRKKIENTRRAIPLSRVSNDTPKKTESIKEQPQAPSEPRAQMDALPHPTRSREELLKALSLYEQEDKELSQRLRVPQKPAPDSNVPEVTRKAEPSHEPVNFGTGRMDALHPVSSPVSQPEPVAAEARAQENWFAVRHADLPAREGLLAGDALSSSRKIQDYYTKPPHQKKNRLYGRPLFLAGIALLVAAGAWGLLRGTGELPHSLSFLSGVKNFFSSSSFLVSEADVEQTFPRLLTLRKSIESAKAANGQSDELGEMADRLDSFFEANDTFSWVGIFKPSSARVIELQTSPQELELLTEIVQLKERYEERSGRGLEPGTPELREYVAWLGFLQQIFEKDGQYLVFTGSEDHLSPAGGEPLFFAVLSVRDGELRVDKQGSATDLNAALTTKIVPPKAVQTIKTDLDLYESTWFFDFETTGKLAALMYEETTQDGIDGVILVSHGTAERLVSQELSGNQVDASWVRDLALHFGSSPAGSWHKTALLLEEAFADGGIQVYFEQDSLLQFARQNNLFLSPQRVGMDTLAVRARTWEGEGTDISLVEYRPTFLSDGSILSEAVVHLENTSAVPSRVYVKIYMPKQSSVLSHTGYSERPGVPAFDYGAEGFLQHEAVNALNERVSENFSQFDLFDEGELLAVGGWVTVGARSIQTAHLGYRLPVRIDWRSGEGAYELAVLPGGGGVSFPFHFAGSYEEGMSFDWKEPLGFVTNQSAEYQKSVRDILRLSAQIHFPDNVTN